MPFYEYKVVPSPEKAPKVRGLKGPERFAAALESLMNELANDGWEYLRAETLPDTERQGFTGKATVTRNILIFRRELYFEEPAEEIPAAHPEPKTTLTAEPDAPQPEKPTGLVATR